MTDVSITPEDRERLAKSKFGEWFDEFFDKKFEEAFEKKASATRKTANKGATDEEVRARETESEGKHETPHPRRRSLLETCLSDTFGF